MRTFAQKPKAPQQTTPAKSTKPSRTFVGQSREVTSILYLQRTIGNHAVQRLLDANTMDVKTDSATTEIAHFGHDFSQIPVHAADLTTPAQPTIQQPAQDPNQLEGQPVPPAQQLSSCTVRSRVNEVIDPTDPSTVPGPAPRSPGRHPLGITHLFVRGHSIKEVQLTSGNAAVADLVFPRIGTSSSLGLEGKRCHLTKPRPASTDPGTYSRASVLTAGPWRRLVDINHLDDFIGRTPLPCDGVTGRTTLVVGGHPSVDGLRRAVRVEEMQHVADQERAVCRHLGAYETAVRALPSSFVTGLLTNCEEEAERRTGRRRMDRLRDFIRQIVAANIRRHAGGAHTHSAVNFNIPSDCRRIEYDINVPSAPVRAGGLILPP